MIVDGRPIRQAQGKPLTAANSISFRPKGGIPQNSEVTES